MSADTEQVFVLVASTGRPAEIELLVERLGRQTRLPARIVLSVIRDADLPSRVDASVPTGVGDGAPPIQVVRGTPGLCAQRNAALDALDARTLAAPGTIVVFYDDDFVPSLHALEQLACEFAQHPGLVGCDGRVLADGVTGSGIDQAEAVRIVDAHERGWAGSGALAPHPVLAGLYGCNMAYRGEAIGALRFDERLPLYGWQEDVDFANRVLRTAQAACGATPGAIPGVMLGRSDAFVGVHRGVKQARSPGRPLGYSQVANPVYLMRKGSMSRRSGVRLLARNVAANVLRFAAPEPWVDRRGRLSGNFAGFADLLRGRLAPERMLDLRPSGRDRAATEAGTDAEGRPAG